MGMDATSSWHAATIDSPNLHYTIMQDSLYNLCDDSDSDEDEDDEIEVISNVSKTTSWQPQDIEKVSTLS